MATYITRTVKTMNLSVTRFNTKTKEVDVVEMWAPAEPLKRFIKTYEGLVQGIRVLDVEILEEKTATYRMDVNRFISTAEEIV